MADGRHIKIVKSSYLSEKSSDFDEIWYTTADIDPDDSHVIKTFFSKFKMADSHHGENRHNSSTDCPILAKFCRRKQNGMSTKAT